MMGTDDAGVQGQDTQEHGGRRHASEDTSRAKELLTPSRADCRVVRSRSTSPFPPMAMPVDPPQGSHD